MILTVFHGFCMALVDSVPGVSGGTLASIPFIAAAERTALKRLRGALFALLDMAVVVLTLLRGSSALGSVSFASLSPLSLLYIFSSSSTNASGSKGAPSSRIRTIRLPSSKRRTTSPTPPPSGSTLPLTRRMAGRRTIRSRRSFVTWYRSWRHPPAAPSCTALSSVTAI